MAETYRTGSPERGSSPWGTGASSSTDWARGATRGSDPTYGARHPFGSASDHDEHDENDDPERYGNRIDDVVPVLGILIGGAVGYLLATTLSGDSSESSRRRSMLGLRSARGTQAGWAGMDRTGTSRQVERDESTDLIASNKVEGTAVYNRQGEQLGEVYNFMVGKRSGRVAYAVMSFGGFLGMGQRYHALPWEVLTYDPNRGGYVIDADRDLLMKAPSYPEGEDPFSRSDHMRRIRDYWSSGRLSL